MKVDFGKISVTSLALAGVAAIGYCAYKGVQFILHGNEMLDEAYSDGAADYYDRGFEACLYGEGYAGDDEDLRADYEEFCAVMDGVYGDGEDEGTSKEAVDEGQKHDAAEDGKKEEQPE